MEIFATLRKAFPGMPDAELRLLADHARLRTLAKGEALIASGDKATEVAFVVTGALRKFYVTLDGKEFIREFSLPGDFVAPYSSLLQKQPSDVTIEALEKTTLITAPWKLYDELSTRHAGWREIRLRIAEQLFVKREQKEADFLLLTTRERYAKFIRRYRGLMSKIPQHFVASYLGITPVALSRLRRK